MHISPYLELAPVDLAHMSAVQPSNSWNEYDDPYKTGAFEDILAGLISNSAAENVPLEPDDSNAAENVILATPLYGTDNPFAIETSINMENYTVFDQTDRVGSQAKDGLFSGNGNTGEISTVHQHTLTGTVDHTARFQDGQTGDGYNDALSAIIPETGHSAELAERFSDSSGTNAQSTLRRLNPNGNITNDTAHSTTQAALSHAQGDNRADAQRATEQKNASIKHKSIDAADTAQTSELSSLRANQAVGGAGKTGSGGEEALADGKKGRSGRNGRISLDEIRSRELRGQGVNGERLTFDVRDFRTGAGGIQQNSELRMNTAAERTGDSGSREVVLELRISGQAQQAPSADTSWNVKSSQAYENLLARELHQNFNNDIVRHASMILKDEGRGIIRLALHPESLGNVKIRLEMADNKITGHIIVESKEALRAFEREIHSLEQAFKDSGFQGASLEMSLASEQGGANQFQQDAQARSLLSGNPAARYEVWDVMSPSVETIDVYQKGHVTINMLA